MLYYLDYANSLLIANKNRYFAAGRFELTVVDTAVAEGKPGVRYRTQLWIDGIAGLQYACQVSAQNNAYVFEVLPDRISLPHVGG